jgi:hypothetical protein
MLLITGGDLEAAIALVEQLPAQIAIDLVNAIVETKKTPEEIEKDNFNKWKKRKLERANADDSL